MVLSKNDPQYRQCSVSVMDNIADLDFFVDGKGISNYYYDYQKIAQQELFVGADGEHRLEVLISQIKAEGKGKPYDCITGVSGGVDSSYLIYKAKQWGLRPLIVHFDNGWNSEIAVKNINNIIQKTGFELYTIVVDWEEFKDLQLAYIKAGVVDWEVPTDHAIAATWYRLAKKYNVKTILSGNNVVTEAILPKSWIYNKSDYTNLLSIHKAFGTRPLKTFPLLGFREHYFQTFIQGARSVKPLNYVKYDKDKAKEVISKELGWVDYGGKHYESVYTKFYQAYVLPTKFGIDKRKPHLSNMIFSGQISREQALTELEEPLYTDIGLSQDIEYVIKKFGLTMDEFKTYLELPRVEHIHYGKQQFITERFPLIKLLKPFVKLIKNKAR